MSRATLVSHYTRLITLWPKDLLRPISFQQKILKSKLAKIQSLSDVEAQKELLSINALYSLVENRYSSKYPLSSKVMNPPSSPDYYNNLAREIEEAPNRSWLRDKVNKFTGMFRFR